MHLMDLNEESGVWVQDGCTQHPECLSVGLIGVGGWDPSGCMKQNTSLDYTTCVCDHLTHFGVLLV